MEKFLVTGSAGFIGFHVAQRLLQDGRQVLGLDNVSDYYDVRLEARSPGPIGRTTRIPLCGSRFG